MAIDDELLKNYIKTKELESTADSNDMLSALKYASMIRLGIGVQRQAQLGESGYDVAAKAIDETAATASDLMTGYAKVATATGTTKKDKITLMKDAQSIWENFFYQRDAVTGGLKLKHTDLYFIRNDEPSGPSAARNQAAKHVWEDSDAFMMLDADDLYLQNKIQKSVDKFLEDPQHIGIVYTDAVIKNLNTNSEVHEYREPFDRQRLERECIISNTPLINKTAFGKAGGYDETMRTCEDWDLWLRITENFVAIHIPEPLSTYSVTGFNSSDTISSEVWNRNWEKIHERVSKGHG